MKTRFLLFLTLLLSIVSMMSCNNKEEAFDDQKGKVVNTDKVLFDKFDLTKIKPESVDLAKFNIEMKGVDISEIEIYSHVNTNEIFIIYPDQVNSQHYTLFKLFDNQEEYFTVKEIDLLFDIDCNGSGLIEIHNKSEDIFLSSIYIDGIKVKTTQQVNKQSDSYNKGQNVFCQREENETFRECFNRLEDEVCDDFIGTVAWITNPTIQILAAAMCTC